MLADTVSPTAAHDLRSVLHVILAGAFTYWLLIELEVNPLAALLGAIAWMFGSFTLAWLQLEVVAPFFAWFPACLVSVRRAVTRSWMWVPVAALPSRCSSCPPTCSSPTSAWWRSVSTEVCLALSGIPS